MRFFNLKTYFDLKITTAVTYPSLSTPAYITRTYFCAAGDEFRLSVRLHQPTMPCNLLVRREILTSGGTSADIPYRSVETQLALDVKCRHGFFQSASTKHEMF